MEYVDTKEAMRILGISSPTTIREYDKKGITKPYRIIGTKGKKYRVEDLKRVLRKGYL
jgi:DNA-binding transcriptional MerR regulator